jgi:tetratricopeptide (TPR) repeat protein
VWRERGLHAQSEPALREALQIAAPDDRRTRALLLETLADACMDDGPLDEAHAHLEEAIRIHRDLGNRYGLAHAMADAATLQRKAGRYAESESAYHYALAMVRELQDVRGEGQVLGNFGMLLRHIGRHQEAVSLLEQAMAMHARVGNHKGQATHGAVLGIALLATGRPAEARAVWLEAARRLTELGDDNTLAESRREMLAACSQAGVPPFDQA